jgi:HSP20 family protein
VDVHESDKAYTIEAELPGMDDDDIHLELNNDLLTLKGEKKEERKEDRKDYHLTERPFGSFQRSFRLPEGVDRDAIAADFKKGVLTVTLPKSKTAQAASRKIPVKG